MNSERKKQEAVSRALSSTCSLVLKDHTRLFKTGNRVGICLRED